MIFNVVAVVLSVLALASSTYLALQQSVTQRRANHLPAVVELLNNFRSVEFNDNYEYVCSELRNEHDPMMGISNLPRPARRAFYDVTYLYQSMGTLRLFGIIDDTLMKVTRFRVIQLWDAVRPYVERERELRGTSGGYLLRILEEYAADAGKLPVNSIDLLFSRRRRRLSWRRPGPSPRARRRESATSCQ
jgi:hypothetical protein